MSEGKVWRVYGLYDPREGERVRYVGVTTMRPLSNRLAMHVNTARLETQKGHHTIRAEWIRDVLNAGFRPKIHQLQLCFSKEEGLRVEREWIERYGWDNLVNQKLGGPRAITSPEARANLSAAGKARWAKATPEERAAVGERGRKNILEAGKLGQAARRGQKHSPESLEKMRQAKLGKQWSEESRQKLRDTLSSPEAHQRMSERTKRQNQKRGSSGRFVKRSE